MFKGTVIAQIIAVIGAIYLAKIYGEEAYGYFSFFISTVSIASIIATLQLDKCIVLAHNRQESINWYNFLVLLVPISTTTIFILFYLSAYFISPTKIDTTIILLAFVGCLLTTYNLINESYFTFKERFKIISASKIYVTIINVGFQFILYQYYNLLGLIIGFCISQFLILLFYLQKNKQIIYLPNFTKVRAGIKKNNTIIKFLLPSTSLNSLATNLMPILILMVFGAKEAGVYFFSNKILGTPLTLISTSIAQVYFKKATVLLKENTRELLRLTKKIVLTNVLIMLFFLVVINTMVCFS